MLGFAVVDVSPAERAVAVWLTSAAGSSAVHSNAVVRGFDDLSADNGQLLALIADRFVVLSERTNADHSVLAGAQIIPCAVDDLAAGTSESHSDLSAAIVEYAASAGRGR